jgi:hypothetical protein
MWLAVRRALRIHYERAEAAVKSEEGRLGVRAYPRTWGRRAQTCLGMRVSCAVTGARAAARPRKRPRKRLERSPRAEGREALRAKGINATVEIPARVGARGSPCAPLRIARHFLSRSSEDRGAGSRSE